MATRVTAAEVKEILDTSLSDAVIEAFIQPANLTITELLGASGLSTATLKEIERWFAAHLLACTRERQSKMEVAGDAQISYQGVTEMGLDATFYGQQVKVLDTTGLMAASIGKRAASVYAITSFENEDTGLDEE